MKRILVVDDEEAIRILFAEELSDEGYAVCTSSNYAALLDTVRDCRPDLIIFDVRAGKPNDINGLQDIRNAYRNIPIILCSSCPILSPDMKSRVADFYIRKSADVGELKGRVKKTLAADMPQQHQGFPKNHSGTGRESAAGYTARA